MQSSIDIIFHLLDAKNLSIEDGTRLRQHLDYAITYGRSMISGQCGNLESFLNFLLTQNIKGAVLLRFINVAFNGSPKKFIETALNKPDDFRIVFNAWFYPNLDGLKLQAEKSLQECLDVI